MKSFIKFSNKVELISGKINKNIILEIINDYEINTVQISAYISEKELKLVNEIFEQRPDLTFRVHWFIEENHSCDLKFMSQLSAVKRLSVDSLLEVTNLDVIEQLDLEELKLDVFELKDYTVVKNLCNSLKKLSISNGKYRNAIFDCNWLLKHKSLKELYLAKLDKNIENFVELDKLKKLTIRGIKLNSLEFLKDTNINDLSIHWCSMSDLSSLSNNNKIQHLELWRVLKLEDLSFVSTLPNLKTIRLIDLANVKEFPDVKNNEFLESIYIENLRNFKDSAQISKAENVKVIEIRH